MDPKRQYRQLLLFVVVLIIPSILVAVGGWIILAEDRATRLKNERQSALIVRKAEIAREVQARLDNIKFQEMGSTGVSDPAVTFVGWTDRDRLVMPWEQDPNSETSRRAIKQKDFADRIDEAWRSEFTAKQEAAAIYRSLARSAEDDHQRAFARLKLAGVLKGLGSQAEAEAESVYRDLLSLPSNLVDENGLSFASYAALALGGVAGREVLVRVERDLESPAALTLQQAFRWRLVVDPLASNTSLRAQAKSALDKLASRIDTVQRIEEYLKDDPDFEQLRKEFGTLGVTDRAWLPYGRNWMISRTPSGTGFRQLLIAVQRESIFAAIRAARQSDPTFTITVGGDSGEFLDAQRLPDVKIDLSLAEAAADTGVDIKRWFYAPAILLVLILNLFGGYLLWRDTRREVRVAELRSQFVSSVSHELKTPLTAIRMFAEILQTPNSVNAETRHECVDTIVNESERLTRLLNNVLDFSRIEHGQKTYRMEPTRLADVVSAAAKTMQYPLAEQGFDLRMEIGDEIPPINADRDALKQAVLNLLTNAMKYSGQSRGIELRLIPQNGDALIQVADHGIGIPHGEQSRIFERFYRAAVPENQSISGTGLGLSLVAHIVQAHGGSVHVESSPGSGSTFSIRIPVHAESLS